VSAGTLPKSRLRRMEEARDDFAKTLFLYVHDKSL
jgi:hypothetical protein